MQCYTLGFRTMYVWESTICMTIACRKGRSTYVRTDPNPCHTPSARVSCLFCPWIIHMLVIYNATSIIDIMSSYVFIIYRSKPFTIIIANAYI